MTLGKWLLLTGALFAASGADDKLDEYLTKDGKLTRALEVRDVQGGFAGFTGRVWTVDPAGRWTTGRVFNQKIDVEKKGELTKEQLAALAKELARHDLANLKSEGKPTTNPHVVTIKFGDREATLNLGAGQPLPKPDPKGGAAGRYAGIVKAVEALLKDGGKEKP